MKVYLLLAALLSIHSGCCLSRYNELCFNRHGDYLKHPSNCHKFIRCSHGAGYEFQCPGNLWWRQEVKSCDYAYRTKCILNVNTAFEIFKNAADENLTKMDISDSAVNKRDNISNNAVLLEGTLKPHKTNFSEIKLSNPKQLSTAEVTVTFTQQYIDNFTIDQDFVTLANQSNLNFTTDNISQLLTTQDDVYLLDDNTLNNVSNLSTTEGTTIVTEQVINTFIVDKVPDKVVTPSTAEDAKGLANEVTDNVTERIISLSETFIKYVTAESISQLSTERSTIYSTTVNVAQVSTTQQNTISLPTELNKNVTAESTPKLTTMGYTKNLTDPLDVMSTELNFTELSVEKDTAFSTKQLPGDYTTVYYQPEISTKQNTTNLTGKTEDYSTETENGLKLSAELNTTIKSPVSLYFNDKKTEALTITTTTATIYSTTPQVMESLKVSEISQNSENKILTNNKNGKKIFINLNKVSTPTSEPSHSQPPIDSTTQDPRLPFRAIECQGENNRQQIKALKCYQYYQCFAGWAFLLNCREGWWFQPDLKRCIQDEDNECGY